MCLYSLPLECNVFRTSCGICKGGVHDLIVRRVKYEYVHNFIVVGCVCVQGVGVVVVVVVMVVLGSYGPQHMPCVQRGGEG